MNKYDDFVCIYVSILMRILIALVYIQFMNSSANIVRMLRTSENPNKMPTQIQYQCHSVSNPLILRIASPTVLAFA